MGKGGGRVGLFLDERGGESNEMRGLTRKCL